MVKNASKIKIEQVSAGNDRARTNRGAASWNGAAFELHAVVRGPTNEKRPKWRRAAIFRPDGQCQGWPWRKKKQQQQEKKHIPASELLASPSPGIWIRSPLAKLGKKKKNSVKAFVCEVSVFLTIASRMFQIKIRSRKRRSKSIRVLGSGQGCYGCLGCRRPSPWTVPATWGSVSRFDA